MKCYVEPELFECPCPCSKVLPCGHTCQDVCGRPCTRNCPVILKERAWPCGHLLSVACHRNPDNFPCSFTLQRTLPCGHAVTAKCSEDLTLRKCQQKVGSVGLLDKYCTAEVGKRVRSTTFTTLDSVVFYLDHTHSDRSRRLNSRLLHDARLQVKIVKTVYVLVRAKCGLSINKGHIA